MWGPKNPEHQENLGPQPEFVPQIVISVNGCLVATETRYFPFTAAFSVPYTRPCNVEQPCHSGLGDCKNHWIQRFPVENGNFIARSGKQLQQALSLSPSLSLSLSLSLSRSLAPHAKIGPRILRPHPHRTCNATQSKMGPIDVNGGVHTACKQHQRICIRICSRASSVDWAWQTFGSCFDKLSMYALCFAPCHFL